MLLDIIHRHRTKGAQSDVEGQIDQLHTFGFDFLQQFLGKMQTSGWSGSRAVFFGIDSGAAAEPFYLA